MTNDELGVINRVIAAQADLAAELREDRAAIGGLAHEVHGLATEIREERKQRQDSDARHDAADKKLNERVDRIARESASRVVKNAVLWWVPVATVIGAGVGWILKEGPAVWLAWQMMFP